MGDSTARRLGLLGAHLAPTATGLEGLSAGHAAAAATSPDVPHELQLVLEHCAAAAVSPDVQRELQLLLEHDSHAQRDRMKALCATELFVP